MSTLAEASFLIQQLAEPRPVGDSVKGAIRRAHRRLSIFCTRNGIAVLGDGRVRKIWYGDSTVRLSAEELEAIRGANAAKKQKAHHDYDGDYHSLASRLESARRALEMVEREIADLYPAMARLDLRNEEWRS